MITVSAIETAIKEKRGNISAVARSFGVSRNAIDNRINKSPVLKEALKQARDTMLDNAETALYDDALNGNTTALIFFLKTQGKARGYVERQELQHTVTWQDKVVDALKQGKIKPEAVRQRWGDELASQFFRQAGVNVESAR